MGILGRLLLAATGAGAARAVLNFTTAAPRSGSLERTNFRGRTVTLAGGPAFAVSASVSSALGARDGRTAVAALTAGLTSGIVGLYDDVAGAQPDQKAYKGFKGHLRALKGGKVTGGLVKVGGVGVAALVASALLPSKKRGLIDVVLGAGVIAGAANLANLLDLRPGRALKAGLLVSAPMLPGRHGGLVAGPVGAATALLPSDLGEKVMLGDSGANAFGALLGVAAVARTGRFGRFTLLAGLTALNLASEKVSFTKVIERTPVLRELDGLGRRKD